MKEEWAEHLEGYFRDTLHLELAVLLFDIRHGLTPLDEQMVEAMRIYKRPWIAVLTKADKLNTRELNEAIRGAHDLLEPQGASVIIPYSSETHRGRTELWNEIFAAVKK
jgi:GTP-binding protein